MEIISDRISPTFCVLPWMQVHVDEAGRVIPCCGTYHKHFTTKWGNEGPNINRKRIPEVWNNSAFRKTREEMLSGNQPKACIHCFYQESLGGDSMRLNKNREVLNNELVREKIFKRVEFSKKHSGKVKELPFSYDLRPGKICSLKCRMCSAKWSSLIENDPVHSQWSPAPEEPLDRSKAMFKDYYEDTQIISKRIIVDPSIIEHLHFGGGEPFIMPAVQKTLQNLVDSKDASRIRLTLVSNLTKITDQMLINLNSFRHTGITASVDGYRNVYEYIRYPGKWDNLVANIDRLNKLQQVTLGCRPTLQLYNILSITDLLDYLESQNIQWRIGFVTGPPMLSARLLSEKGKNTAATRLESFMERSTLAAKSPSLKSRVRMIIKDMNKPFPETRHKQLIRDFMMFTNDLDRTRNQSIHETLPEVSRYVAESAGGWIDLYRYSAN